MKTIKSVGLGLGLSLSLSLSLICAAAACAQTQPTPPISAPSLLQDRPMTSAEKIKQLQPATNPVELMQLLRAVHEQGLLIDPSFMEDENILRLFGEGRIEERRSASGRLNFKRFIAGEKNNLQFPIRISGVKQAPGFGGIYIGGVEGKLPFNYELIETYLLPGVQGEDPYGPLKPMTNEARNKAGGRPLATHPKGYWVYWDRKKSPVHSASVYAPLGRNAEVLNIHLEQQENEK